MDNFTNSLIEDLGNALGIDADQIRKDLDARQADVSKHNARAKAHNENACQKAVGKKFTVRTSTNSTITGIIESAKVTDNGGAFEIVLLQSGKYRFGPYRVRQLPK